MSTRRYFSPEFKAETASKVLDGGMSVRQVCQSFDLGTSTLRRWGKQLREERNGGATEGHKPISSEQRRIRELESQVRRLEEEKTILKKATAFFVQEQAGRRPFTK